MEKRIDFIGSSYEDLMDFPVSARREAGYQLGRVQQGAMPQDWKPMARVGAGAYGIRIHAEGEWRVIYVARFSNAIYVLHSFQKKTAKTSAHDIALAADRYKQIGK